MDVIQKNLLAIFLFCNIVSISTYADSGLVKFINHTNESFSITNVDQQKSAQIIGLPITIPTNTDKDYYITLLNADVGEHYQYISSNGKLHFSINVSSTQTFIHHHTTLQTVDYLTVNWENSLQNSDIHYVSPLFWNDNSYLNGQPVRVDSHNNAIIGIFSQEPNNVLTVMSYNTDKDGTGTDHNPQYHQTSDILNLFTSGRLPTPDILMIQEGLAAQDFSAYQQTLAHVVPGKWFGYYATEGSRSDSNIILISPKYNSSEIQFGTFSFKNQCGWGLVGKRNAVYADIPMADILQQPAQGNFRIFDTHLESGSGSDIFLHAAQVRLAQFNEILNYPRSNVDMLFVGGDFNTMPIFDDITGLTKYQLGDLTSIFDQYAGDSHVNWGQPTTCTWSTCATYTLHAGMWLDRLFISALSVPSYKLYVLYPYVAHHVDGYSDHLPVWVTFYFYHKPSASTDAL